MSKLKFQSNVSVSSKNAKKVLDMLEEHNEIHRFEIMEILGLSMAQMIPFNSYLEFKLGSQAEYDKSSKMWKLLPDFERDLKD